MRGRKSQIAVQFIAKRRKKAVTVACMQYGPLAVHKKLAEDGTLMDKYVVTHIATGLKWPFCFRQREARQAAAELASSGINWDFSDRDRMSRPDRIKAAEILERMKR